MVEHLKVLISRAPKGPYGRAPKGDGGLISRACLRILISRAPKGPYGRAPKGPLLFNLLIGWGGLWSSPLKGDGGLNSRACLRIQFTYWVGGLMVEHLKVRVYLLPLSNK